MATVTAFIRVSTKKAEKVNVRFRLRDGRSIQLFHKSEITVNPDNFDDKAQKIKAKVMYNAAERQAFDKSIAERKDIIFSLYNEQPNKESLTSDWLESAIEKIIKPEQYNNEIKKPAEEALLAYIARFIKKAPERKDKKTGRLLNFNNLQQYKATEKHLLKFAEIEKRSEYQFSEINNDFYNRFVSYLQNEIIEKDKKGKPLYIPVLDEKGKPVLNDDGTPNLKIKVLKEKFTQNSVGKHIKILKIMLAESAADTSSFYVFTEEIDSVYLNEAELQQLKDFDLSNSPHLARVRDWFLLLAWTGSRFSDLSKIGSSNIKDNFITFRQQKTNTKVTIPLHPVVLDILKKYNFAMPEPISNQRFNEYIKEVCKLAQIDGRESFTRTVGGKLKTEIMPKYELVSSHTCRRSFCTNMYKRGLPTLMIMSISGHKTEKSFLKYIKVKQDEHAAMMATKWKEIYK